jgi:hypothetical protein
MSMTVHVDGNRQFELEEFPEGITTVGEYADQVAADNIGSSDVADREFSFKVDGRVADRDEDLGTIEDGSFLELVEVTVLAETTDAAVATDDQPHTVKDILDYVGDDVDKAQTALDDELAKPADEQRSTLVEKLQAIITPAE